MSVRRTSKSSHRSKSTDPPSLDPFTQGYVRKQARGLIGKHGFHRCDRGDVEQRLYLKLVGSLPAADPDSPKWKAFVTTAVRRHLASMIRDGRAKKRDYRRSCSLYLEIGTLGARVALADTVREHAIPSRHGCAKRSDQELAELRLDMAACLAVIDGKLHREFCERLKHDSISHVARDMSIPRTTLNTWLAKLRGRFEERGLKRYL